MKALKEREHKVIYKDGDKVVKVFDETFSKADVLNEALNMARVEETGLRIPKLLNVSKVDGKWAITREYIEGTPLSQLMAQHPEKQDEYLNTFVDIQLEILGKTWPTCAACATATLSGPTPTLPSPCKAAPTGTMPRAGPGWTPPTPRR